MKNIIKKHFWLFLILISATSLHLYKLGQVPRILNPDEASIAYNALLLNETGKDEWGKTWPLVLDAFGDQKLIGYPALVVFIFHVFGYNDLSVKVPSLIAGSLLILLIYIIQLQLHHSKKQAVVSAALVALVPVFFFYSRVAFEAMVALVYLLSGFSLLLESKIRVQTKQVILLNFFSILFFVLALFTYNSPLILIPLLLISIVIDRGFLNWRKWVGIVTVITLAWVLFTLYFIPLTIQKSRITLFGDETTLNEFNEYRGHLKQPLRTLIGNKYVFYGDKMLVGYIRSWSPAFLMNNVGGHPWHTMQGFGYLYWSVYFTGLIGIFSKIFFVARDFKKEALKEKSSLLRFIGSGKFTRSSEIALFLVFVLSLAPVVITVNAPQATRSLLFLFLWCYYAAYGFLVLSKIFHIMLSHYLNSIEWLKTEVANTVILGLLFCLVLFEAGNYFTYYFGPYNEDNKLQSMFQPGFQSIIQTLENEHPEPLAIVDERGFNYILLAWYLKLEPNFFFSTIKKQQPDKINFKFGEQLGRYHFVAKPIDRREDEKTVLQWNYGEYRWETLNY